MALDISALPDEVRALIAAQATTIARQQAELSERHKLIARLQTQLAKLRRMHFGRASERLNTEITQLELALEELEEQEAVRPDEGPATAPSTEADVLKPARRPLPEHLLRETITHPTACTCPRCGGQLRRLIAGAIRYALSRWTALTRYLDDGTLAIDNNAVERAIRPLVLGRKNWLFAGSDSGGERAAAIYSMIETAKINGLDPEAYLHNVLERIADHPVNRVGELLPWNINVTTLQAAA